MPDGLEAALLHHNRNHPRTFKDGEKHCTCYLFITGMVGLQSRRIVCDRAASGAEN